MRFNQYSYRKTNQDIMRVLFMSHTFLTKIISKAFYDAVSFSIRIPTTYFELGPLIAKQTC